MQGDKRHVAGACATVLALGAVAMWGAAANAWAAFPGENGKLAFVQSSVPGCDDQFVCVVTANSDGSAHQPLRAGSQPTWSPSGRTIAFVGHVGFDTFVTTMNSRGARLSVVGRQLPDRFRSSPSFTPDGKTVAWVTDQYRLYQAPMKGVRRPRLLRHFAYPVRDIAFSSTGRLAFSKATTGDRQCPYDFELHVARTDGSGPRLTSRRLTQGAEVFGLDWSPDGRRLVFASASPPRRAARADVRSADDPCKVAPSAGWGDNSGGIYVMNVATKRMRRLTTSGSDPVFSPDGRRIAFGDDVVTSTGVRTGYVHVMDADGRNVTPIAPGGGPSWQPRP